MALIVRNLPANTGDQGWIPGLGRPPGGGNGNPLQYSWLGKPMDKGARDFYFGRSEILLFHKTLQVFTFNSYN